MPGAAGWDVYRFTETLFHVFFVVVDVFLGCEMECAHVHNPGRSFVFRRVAVAVAVAA